MLHTMHTLTSNYLNFIIIIIIESGLAASSQAQFIFIAKFQFEFNRAAREKWEHDGAD